MAIRILLWKSMCGLQRPNVFTPDQQGLSLILGPIQRRIFGFAWHACIYIYIYSSLLLKLVQGWKNLSSYLVLLWGCKDPLEIIYLGWGGGGGWESPPPPPPPQLNSIHDIGQPNAQYSAIKLESQTARKPWNAQSASWHILPNLLSSHTTRQVQKGSRAVDTV